MTSSNEGKFERLLKNSIPHRNWNTLSSKWLEYIPTIEPSGSNPDTDLGKLYSLEKEIAIVTSRVTGQDPIIIKCEPEGLRSHVFREGVFFLHKASHVIGAAEFHAKKGILTWSLSNAYHGAFFGVQAITRFLGLATAIVENKHWIIDIYPELEELSSKDRKRGLEPPAQTFCLCPRTRIEHRHIWCIFQRLMRVCKFEDERLSSLGKTFSNLDPLDFARQRNSLHYDSNVWFFEDIYEFVDCSRLKLNGKISVADIEFKDIVSNFSLLLSFAILFMGLSLMEGMAEKTNMLTNEIALLMKSLSRDRHPFYSPLDFN